MKVYYGCQKILPIQKRHTKPLEEDPMIVVGRIYPNRRKTRPKKELAFIPYLNDREPMPRRDLNALLSKLASLGTTLADATPA